MLVHSRNLIERKKRKKHKTKLTRYWHQSLAFLDSYRRAFKKSWLIHAYTLFSLLHQNPQSSRYILFFQWWIRNILCLTLLTTPVLWSCLVSKCPVSDIITCSGALVLFGMGRKNLSSWCLRSNFRRTRRHVFRHRYSVGYPFFLVAWIVCFLAFFFFVLLFQRRSKRELAAIVRLWRTMIIGANLFFH
jgi:hypothetical protein